jgi:hypothetical protein
MLIVRRLVDSIGLGDIINYLAVRLPGIPRPGFGSRP